MRLPVVVAAAFILTACGSEVIRVTSAPPGLVIDVTATDLAKCVRAPTEACYASTICVAPMAGEAGRCVDRSTLSAVRDLGGALGDGAVTELEALELQARQAARGCDVPIWPEVRCDALTDP